MSGVHLVVEHTLPFLSLWLLVPPLSWSSSPLFTLALVLLSPRSSESEVSVRRKVSLVLEQMQPLGVSDLLGSGLAP